MKINRSTNLPLDKFIEFALYNKNSGYYMKKNPFGKKGDFITAPNTSRLFSEMISIWILSFWENLGSPKNFNLVELGAGNGEMMKILIESFQNCNSRCVSLARFWLFFGKTRRCRTRGRKGLRSLSWPRR